MRGIKPFKLGLIARPFEWGRRHHLGISVLGYFPFDPPDQLFADVEMWPELEEILGQDLTIDVGIPKSRAEFLVMGKAHTPDGVPSATCPVRAEIGALSKSLYVIGDRFWRNGVPTEPKRFTEMDLSWANAFGGEGYDKNPRGKGFKPVKGEGGAELHPLPNVELPKKLITSPKERPEPAGFGPIDFTWPQRFSMSGTYDRRWLDTRYPGFAEDMDWRIWNMAPVDQQQEAFFTGSEKLVFENMHPGKPRLEAALPNLRARSFITRHGDEDRELVEVEMRLTTVWLFPSVERGVVIFQGAIPVREDDAADIDVLMIAAERPHAPRSMDHYRDVLAKRLDRDRLEEQLNDADLVPPELAGLGAEIDHQIKLTSVEGLRAKRKRAAAAVEIERARAEIAALGLDPDGHGPQPLAPEEPIPALSEIGEFVRKKRAEMEAERAKAEARQEKMIAEAAKFYEEAGLDFDEVRQEMETPHRGPPTFSADAERAQFRRWADEMKASGQPYQELEHYATDPEQYARWREFETRLAETYRSFAHFQKPALRRDDDQRAAIQREIFEGKSFARRDLTGLDLSELDLSGADFEGAFLESVSLVRADLRNASFKNAVLAHADLTGAKLNGACFAGANLGKARLVEVETRGEVDLSGAQLWGADLEKADLSGANLQGATLLEANLVSADLSHARGEQLFFHKTPLSGARFTGAVLKTGAFIEVDARGVDFGGALLEDAGFVNCNLDGCSFVNAQMAGARVVLGSSAREADFRGACLNKANLRGVALVKCDFSGAQLNGADLSEADLSDGRFYRIIARESMWVKAKLNAAFLVSADLFGAILQKADLRGADLRGANLYGADFALVCSDRDTNVTDAIQLKVRVKPLREEPS